MGKPETNSGFVSHRFLYGGGIRQLYLRRIVVRARGSGVTSSKYRRREISFGHRMSSDVMVIVISTEVDRTVIERLI